MTILRKLLWVLGIALVCSGTSLLFLRDDYSAPSQSNTLARPLPWSDGNSSSDTSIVSEPEKKEEQSIAPHSFDDEQPRAVERPPRRLQPPRLPAIAPSFPDTSDQ